MQDCLQKADIDGNKCRKGYLYQCKQQLAKPFSKRDSRVCTHLQVDEGRQRCRRKLERDVNRWK
eukprot:755642-Hanusia_phi.AAC.9